MTAARLEFGPRRNRLIAARTEAVRPEFSGRTERARGRPSAAGCCGKEHTRRSQGNRLRRPSAGRRWTQLLSPKEQRLQRLSEIVTAH